MEKIALIIDAIVQYMIAVGPVGGFILVVFESFLPPMPLGVVVSLNILSFGNIAGFLMSYVATIIGCMMSFYIFRYLFKDRYRNWFNDKNEERINKWMNKLSNIKFTTLVILFALPITPAFLVNIAGGLSDIKAKKYLTALIVGKPAMILFFGYIGVSVIDNLKDPEKLIRIGLLVAITYIISKVIEKIVKVEE